MRCVRFAVNHLFFAVGFIVFFVSGAVVGRADLVLNGSFESPVGTVNGSVEGTPDYWHRNQVVNIDNGTYLNTVFGGRSPDNSVQCIDMAADTTVWQNTGATLQPGYTYALTFYDSPWDWGTFVASIGASSDTSTNGTSFGSQSWDEPNNVHGVNAQWHERTLSATYNGPPGQYLTLSLAMAHYVTGTTNESGWIGFDAFSIIAAPAPEPSAIMILATGLLSLLCYAWRRRR